MFEQADGLDLDLHFMLDHQLWIRIASEEPIHHVSSMWAAARHHESAKNVSQAAGFGRESLEVLNWMQTQPGLAPIVEQNKRDVLSGAYRLNARYLLDGGQYADSLKSYAKAFYYQPGYAASHWHRILYAILGLFGVRNIGGLYTRFQDSRRPNFVDREDLENWPGLCLNQVA